MGHLPADAPATSGEAFARINAVTRPTLDDLKLMVYLEASGQSAYTGLARCAPQPEIKVLLEANGREELAHAHRVAKVIKLLSGLDFAIPADAENPYASSVERPVDRPLLEFLTMVEDNGCTLYETWADNIGHSEAAELLRQNAKEETRHGARAKEALQYL